MHGLCFAAVPLCVKWRNNGPGKLSFGPTTLNRRSSLKATGVGKGKPKTNLLFSKRPEIDSSTLRVLECFFPPLENKNHEDSFSFLGEVSSMVGFTPELARAVIETQGMENGILLPALKIFHS